MYMEAPLGFNKVFYMNKICRLKKVLYGLKQSLGVWFGRLNKVMLKMKYFRGSYYWEFELLYSLTLDHIRYMHLSLVFSRSIPIETYDIKNHYRIKIQR